MSVGNSEDRCCRDAGCIKQFYMTAGFNTYDQKEQIKQTPKLNTFSSEHCRLYYHKVLVLLIYAFVFSDKRKADVPMTRLISDAGVV